MARGRTAAGGRLSELEGRVRKLEQEGRQVAERQQAAEHAARQGHEQLVAALVAGTDDGPARQALERAEAERQQPWPALREAAARKVTNAQAEVDAFIREHISELTDELVPEAVEIRDAWARWLAEGKALKARHYVLGQRWERLARVHEPRPDIRFLEPEVDEILRAAEHRLDRGPIPAPIPRANTTAIRRPA